ncbi:MAG TPA: anhydro-N-acetylmuramic acid kinase [Gammaproteobacteria bacterium]|nr:anhydro-N-acetylmuramic acid kinase [Gammaproteobacteria bacterium]
MADLFIGLMSGTSMDGIDAALVDFTTTCPNIISTHSHRYPAALHRQLEAALELEAPLNADLSAIDAAVGETFAAATSELLLQAGKVPENIIAIGSHGQTIRHEPAAQAPYSLQIGNPDIIAMRTGIDVIADFRRADIEAGGQGAPLVPAFHQAVFASNTEDRVILNIGGIANITILTTEATTPVSGFDTGPGNTLMDSWTRQHLQAAMDNNGDWAASGQVDHALLEDMLTDPYFLAAPPKSTGREHFNPDWLSRYTLRSGANANDIQATLCELTAQTIATAIQAHAGSADRLIVCGGGVHNNHLMGRLAANMPGLAIESTAAYGVTPDWVEAAAFAWLARQRLAGMPGNIPAVTGATRAVSLGQLVKP